MGMEKKMVRVAPPQLGRSLREAEDGLALLGNACREDMPVEQCHIRGLTVENQDFYKIVLSMFGLSPVICPTAAWTTVISAAANSFQ